jgi:hypothetical protein
MTFMDTFSGSPDNLLSGWRSEAQPQEATGSAANCLETA